MSSGSRSPGPFASKRTWELQQSESNPYHRSPSLSPSLNAPPQIYTSDPSLPASNSSSTASNPSPTLPILREDSLFSPTRTSLLNPASTSSTGASSVPQSNSSSSSSTAPPLPPGIGPRRPRAGTLPSTFHIGASNSSSHSLAGSGPGTSASLRHLVTLGGVGVGGGGGGGALSSLLVPPHLNGTTASLPGSGSTTPISDYGYSSAATTSFLPSSSAIASSSLPPPTSSTSNTLGLPPTSSTPNSSHTSSSSSLIPPPIATSRLRSGSLTLPLAGSGLSTAFGPTSFASTELSGWPQTRQAVSGNSSPIPTGSGSLGLSGVIPGSGSGGTGLPVVRTSMVGAAVGGGGAGGGGSRGPAPSVDENLLSPSSSAYGDDSHVRTLDYLGLDGDSPVREYGGFSHLHRSHGGTGGDDELDPEEEEVLLQSRAAGTTQQHQHPLRGRGISLSATPTSSMHRLHSAGNLVGMGGVGQSSTGHSSLSNDLLDLQHHTRLRSATVSAFPRSGLSTERTPISPFPLHATSSASASNLSTLSLTEDDFFSSPNKVNGKHSQEGSSGTGSNPGSLYHRSQDSVDSTRLLYSSGAGEDEAGPGQGGLYLSSHGHHHSISLSTSHSRSPSAGLTAGGGGGTTGGLTVGGPKDSPSRARAATIGILDDSREVFMRKRAGTTAGLVPQHLLGNGAANNAVQDQEYQGGQASVLSRGMRAMSLVQPEEGWHSATAPDISASLTPPPPAPLQQPTRSLWIGNLDAKITTAELQAVFAPYGAIESLRLIPEKECGFVNFVSVSDAVHAKEDVLNRLGGQLTPTSGIVRIGFGKADSTPSVTPTGLRPSFPAATGTVPPGPNGTAASMLAQTQQDANLQSTPTRALWVGSIPNSTTPNVLLSIFAPFGAIESARVLTHKSCGFINFERLEDAIAARKALNGREILGAEVGCVRIGFAKVPTKILAGFPASTDTPSPPLIINGVLPNGVALIPPAAAVAGIPLVPGPTTQLQDYRSNLAVDVAVNGAYSGLENEDEKIETAQASTADLQLLMREISGDAPDTEEHVRAVAVPRPPATYYTSIPQQALIDPALARRYVNADAPRLRDIRKKLDTAQTSIEEIDSIAFDLVDECVALSSDYIGNTLIQKLFERATLPARMALLERIAPHLATIGTHKNGTWAVQKIIQCVQTDLEFAIVEQNLQPYTPPLLLNDFGNYVVQGALRFGTSFVFDAMVDRCWEIGSGRFGARSTRQTLESPQASKLDIKRVAIAIVLNSVPLATNANGALLVTWLLDTSGLPGRYRLLAPRFAPHLAQLCTHKLASIGVLKIINQRIDPKASRILLDALLDPESKAVEEILGDQVHGSACMTRLLASQALEGNDKATLQERLRKAIAALRVQAIPAYRKIIEDVGLQFHGPVTPQYFQPGQAPAPGMATGSQLSSSPPGPSHPQWSPQLTPAGFAPYTQHNFSPAGLNYPGGYPYQQPGAAPSYPFFVPPTYFSPPPSNFMANSPRQNSASPMLAPMPIPASVSGLMSPTMVPASIPGVSSPDPFSALRVGAGDPNSGFHPAFSPPPHPHDGAYYRGRSYVVSPPLGIPSDVEAYYSQNLGY
ncbi:hypothetical protein T439DRAFT_320058 [Meredithblackwellia eburnea MCA 4105]